MKAPRTSLAAALAALVAAAPSPGHEGEEHGAPAAPAPGTTSRHTMTASSEYFELVVKNEPLTPGETASLELYVSDFDTNAPIAGAALHLVLRAQAATGEMWSGSASATPVPGVYVATFTPADTGAVTLLVTVDAENRQAEFALAGLEIGAGGSSSDRAGQRARVSLRVMLLGLVPLLAILFSLMRARRRRLRVTRSLVLVAAVLFPAVATGHEGHDEPPAASGQLLEPGAEVYLGKESQFLLGILTKPVALESVQNELRVRGRIAARSGGELEIVAPQAGRVLFPGGRTPVLGERIRRGQVVATLVVVDSLSLRSALRGVVTEVPVVNGQLVDAGRPILRLLDNSLLWVHADVFEQDLGSVERSQAARVVSPGFPDQSFSGRRVAVGTSLGEVQGTVEVYFEIPNPDGRLRVGMLVDVYIEQGGAQAGFVLPRAALVEKDGRKLVFVHVAPERFAAREVREMANLGERIALREGVLAGDRVVIAGSHHLLGAPVASAGK